MDKKVLLFIFLTLLLVVPSVSAARNTDLFGGLFGDLGKTITEIFKFINVEVRIPHPADYGDEKVTIIQIAAVFMLLFAMFWAGVSRTKVFEGDKMKGAAKAFTIALVLMLIFGSPVTEWVSNWVNTLGRIAIVMIVVVAIFFLVNMTKSGIAGAGTFGAAAAKQGAANLQTIAAARKDLRGALKDLGVIRPGRRGIRNLNKNTKKLIENEQDIEKRLRRIREMILNVGRFVNEGKEGEAEEELKRAIKEIPELLNDIVKSQKIKENMELIDNYFEKETDTEIAAIKELNNKFLEMVEKFRNNLKTLEEKERFTSGLTDKKKKAYREQKIQEYKTKLAQIENKIDSINKNDLQGKLTAIASRCNELKGLRDTSNQFIAEVGNVKKALEDKIIIDAKRGMDNLIALWKQRIEDTENFTGRQKELMRLEKLSQEEIKNIQDELKDIDKIMNTMRISPR